MFDYYASMKSKAKFLMYTYQLMKVNISNAIMRAEMLESYHSTPLKATHLQCPCSKVHHLIKELLS
jgi:hypothetical protein